MTRCPLFVSCLLLPLVLWEVVEERGLHIYLAADFFLWDAVLIVVRSEKGATVHFFPFDSTIPFNLH